MDHIAIGGRTYDPADLRLVVAAQGAPPRESRLSFDSEPFTLEGYQQICGTLHAPGSTARYRCVGIVAPDGSESQEEVLVGELMYWTAAEGLSIRAL